MMMDPSSQPVTFSGFLRSLETLAEHERWEPSQQYVNSRTSLPLIEHETSVVFLFCGEAERVCVPCDANGWSDNGFPMKRIAGTNLWYCTHEFEADARFDYKFLINGTTWILDPGNPNRIEGGYGQNSELRMPRYEQPEDIGFDPGIPHGMIEESWIESRILGNSRPIRVYTPPDYARRSSTYPLLIIHDGLDYLRLGAAQNILDHQIAHRKMEPVIAVFVPPVDRNVEYSGVRMGSFFSFIVDELIADTDRRYRTRPIPSERGTIGASNGGNIALWLGLSYPEVFGRIGAQSSNVVSVVTAGYENSPRLNLKFYLDIGIYDLPQLIPLVREFSDLLRTKGYPCLYRKHHGSHSWGTWRAHLGRALRYLYPPPLPPGGYRLTAQNFTDICELRHPAGTPSSITSDKPSS